MTTAYDSPIPGLYFDGCRGADEIDRLIIDLAEQYGWEGDDGEYGDEFLSEVSDEAIGFLNTLETRQGHFWAYSDTGAGFGLWSEEEP